MDNRGRALHGNTATSPESARASALFEQFVSAGTFKSVLSTYRQLCEVLWLKPTNLCSFYPRLKAKLHSWRAASLWAKLDKRASHKCYNRGKACPNTRVLIIGAGPCGLRAAIEAQLLGAKVVVVEKRDRFSRNNVLHLWPFVIHDLRNLGAKKFFGKFCAGSIDHISIRQLQLILLKVALLLGVEVHENVGFVSLKEPPEDQIQERIGWHACINPSDHPVSQYEFDVLIGADGKRNTLLGFNRKEFRGKLAIAITANFINRHTLEEARVEEISGVAFIFNQKFFQDMREQTGIDLENIVYYKDDTHYFVMTAKKQSLLDRGVIINDYNDTARLLSAENVDREALMEYARDAAAFATDNQLHNQDFAVNHYGQADVAMFDFTSMYAAENACRVTERKGHKLLQGLVGDSLLEPFWPTGSGCGRGFLSSFDVAWMIRSWASGKLTPLQVLAERESIYRLLAQTTPENLSKDLNQYTLNPSSRYPNLNLHAVLPSQVRSLYDTDGKLEDHIVDTPVEIPKKKRKRESIIHPDALLNWCQRQVALHDSIKIENLMSSWKNGLALCAILHRYRPDLINLDSLNPDDAAKNNQLAFDICEKELGIPPVMTGQEMADCEIPDKLSMVSYLAQIYETFRGEIPVVCQPKSSNDERTISPNRQSVGTPRSILTRISNKFQNKRKYSIERDMSKEKSDSLKRGRHPPLLHKRRSKEKDKGIALDFVSSDVALTNFKNIPNPDVPKESINSRVKNLEMKMRRDAGLRCHLIQEGNECKSTPARSDHTELNIKQIQEQLQRNGSGQCDKKPTGIKVGRLRKDEWNVKMIEEKIGQQQKMLQKSAPTERSKIKQEIFNNNLRLIEAKLQTGGSLTAEEKARFAQFDSNLSKLQEQLTKGNLDAGERGHNQVAAMTEHMTTIWDRKVGLKKDPLPPPPVVNNLSPASEQTLKVGGSEICYFCKKRVYLMERLSAEGLFFHRTCFKCEYCSASLRLGNYSFDKDTVCGGKFYCNPHFRMQKPDHRWQEMMKRKQAFLSTAFDEQEKEKRYTTLLAKVEKELSPNKQVDIKNETTVTDSTISQHLPSPDSNVNQKPDAKTNNILLEPINIFGRDQTPERVEYENSILDYSEEELLTSELEEEELTQKNLGPCQDLATSDDEYSDISADSESDEEAYAEELERSLTADETRKLAETWQRKYSTEHSLMDSDASSSSSEEEDVSETEIGSEDGTSDDVNSDEEYSIGVSGEDVSGENTNIQVPNLKTPDLKDDLRVEVPVIDLKSMNQECEDETTTSESDIFEVISGSEKGLEDVSVSEDDSSPKSEDPLPPPQIPTIVIDESPPQDVDQEEEWTQNVLQTSAPNGTDVSVTKSSDEDKVALGEANDANIDVTVNIPKNETSEDDVGCISSDNEILNICQEVTSSTCSTVGICEIQNTAACISQSDVVVANTGENVPDVPETEISQMHVGATGTSIKSTEQVLSKSAAIEQNSLKCDNIDLDESTVSSVLKNESQKPLCVADSDNANIPYSVTPNTRDSIQCVSSIGEHDSTLDGTCVAITKPVEDKINNDSFSGTKSNSFVVESKCSDKTPDKPLTSSEIDYSGKDLLPEKTNGEIVPSLFDAKMQVNDVLCNISCLQPVHVPNGKAIPPSHIPISSPVTVDAISSTVPSQSGDFTFDSTFITMRKKRDKNHNNSFTWDSDNSISLPWFCDEYEDFGLNLSDSVSLKSSSQQQSQDVSLLYKTANETSAEVKQLDSEKSCVSPVVKCDSPSEYFTPCASKLISTPIKPAEKPFFVGNVTANGLLSPISENDVKSIVCKERDNPKVSSHIQTEVIKSCSNETTIPTTNNVSQHHIDESFSSENQQHSKISLGSNQSLTSESSTGKSSKYSGYSGSFSEKIRPKSALGDTIYLRSLDINLQKQQFPSLTKSNDKLDKVEDECKIRKKLFHGSDKSLSQQKHLLNDNSDSCSKGFRRQTSVPSEGTNSVIAFNNIPPRALPSKTSAPHSSKEGENICSQINVSSSDQSKILSSVTSSLIHESYGDPVSPYTYSQNKPVSENTFPVKMRPKCDIDLGKLREKREKRKSVHENIQGLPFADEEKATTPVDPPVSPNTVFIAVTPSEKILSTTQGEDSEQDLLLRSNQTVAQEKARKEARARARLKSDEELGLSPKNYRKKYQRQLSLSSIYYDELNSDEFFDHENEELEDETIDGTFHAKRVQIVEAQSEASDTEPNFDNVSLKSSTESVKSSHSVINRLDALAVKQNTRTSKSTEILPSATTVQDSVHIPKTSSSDTSPDIIESEAPPFNVKDEYSKTAANVSIESLGDDEKLKTANKKSFFSILNFGKGHATKEKSNKSKVKDTERASSLPADLCSKAPPKQKPFSNLKLNKAKEKQRQKHLSAGAQAVIENTLLQNVSPKVTKDHAEEPKSILLSASQAKVVPKYEVYRNPGIRLTAIPNHVPTRKTENGLAPKASEDSFSDTEDDTQRSNFQQKMSDGEKKDKDLTDKEKKAQRVVLKVQRQQELKRLRTAQEIQRRLEELEVQQKELEQQGVELEKVLRNEGKGFHSGSENDLMQQWYQLVHSKNQLLREEQELLIRLKDLELVDRHSRLQQEMRERMAQSATQKNPNQIGEEKKILTEMLRIVEERDELVAMLEQLRLKEEEDEKSFGPTVLGQTKIVPCSSKS